MRIIKEILPGATQRCIIWNHSRYEILDCLFLHVYDVEPQFPLFNRIATTSEMEDILFVVKLNTLMYSLYFGAKNEIHKEQADYVQY